MSLIDRALTLLNPTTGAVAALAIVPLAAATSADAAQLTYGGDHVSWGSGGAYPGPGALDGSVAPDGQSVKLIGNVGDITGADWNTAPYAELALRWYGDNEQPPVDGDFIHVNYDFDVDFTGGEVNWRVFVDQHVELNVLLSQQLFINNTGTLAESGTVEGSATSRMFNDSGYTVKPDGHTWSALLALQWTGYAPTDTFHVMVPAGSIDYQYNFIPEPTGLAGAGLAVGFLLRRRRRA